MTDVFISYSRRDEEFVQRLRSALETRGKNVWFDQDDIGPAVEWRREIALGIEGADVFAGVISPDSLVSEACRLERQHAIEQCKRLVPLMYREPDGIPVPDELASRNYIFFRSTDDFDGAVGLLVAAIDDLPEWARAHTRLLERAEGWSHEERDGSLLLRGSDLRQAETWLAEQNAHKEPRPTPLQAEYIVASRTAATRRQRITIGAVLAALAVSIGLAVVAFVQRNEAVEQSRVAQSRELAAASVAQYQVDPELSVLLGREAVAVEPTQEAERALRKAVAISFVQAVMRGHSAWVGHAAFSPDGKTVATASRDGRAALWDAATGDVRAWLEGHSRGVSWVAFSSDGRFVVTASRDGTARIWDVPAGTDRAVLKGHTDYVSRAAFSPDGARVVTASRDGTARIWDVATGRTVATLTGHTRWVTNAEFMPDGTRVLTASDDGTVRVWDADSGESLQVLRPGAGIVLAATVSPDGREIVSSSMAGDFPAAASAMLWDAETFADLATLPLGGAIALSLAFSPDSRTVAVGSEDGAVRLWDVEAPKTPRVLVGHTGPVTDVDWSGDGAWLATASGDGTARIWDVATGRSVEILRGHGSWVTTASFSPDGGNVLTAGQDGTARIWDADVRQGSVALPTGSPLTSSTFSRDGRAVLTAGVAGATLWDLATRAHRIDITGGSVLANRAELAPDGGLIATAGQDGVARLYAATTGTPVAELAGHTARVGSVSFSPDGRRLVTASDDRTARVWDLASGRTETTLEGGGGRVSSAEFSPDGRLVVTAGGPDQTARIWNADDGAPVGVLRGHSNTVETASFSPDGRRIVTASTDNTARIWDVSTGRTTVVLTGHTGAVVAARFSPDSRFVVTASWDGTARVWDAATGQELLELLGGTSALSEQAVGSPRALTDAAFGPTGDDIVVADLDGTARVYSCEVCGSLADLLRAAPGHATRQLTEAERKQYLHD